jgi:hypothetical protein
MVKQGSLKFGTMKGQCQNPDCGKWFELYHPKDKFCRTSCRVATWRKRKKEKARPIIIEVTQ